MNTSFISSEECTGKHICCFDSSLLGLCVKLNKGTKQILYRNILYVHILTLFSRCYYIRLLFADFKLELFGYIIRNFNIVSQIGFCDYKHQVIHTHMILITNIFSKSPPRFFAFLATSFVWQRNMLDIPRLLWISWNYQCVFALGLHVVFPTCSTFICTLNYASDVYPRVHLMSKTWRPILSCEFREITVVFLHFFVQSFHNFITSFFPFNLLQIILLISIQKHI